MCLFKQSHKRSKKESELKHASYMHRPRKARQEKLDKKHLQTCQLWKIKRSKAREERISLDTKNVIHAIECKKESIIEQILEEMYLEKLEEANLLDAYYNTKYDFCDDDDDAYSCKSFMTYDSYNSYDPYYH